MSTPLLHTRPLPDYLLALLAQKVPAYGMALVAKQVHTHDFAFRFAGPRRSKLGDFTRSSTGDFTLTVNADLGPELFLVTFLHEVAHLQATLHRKRREAPHGIRWQTAFGVLIKELCAQSEGQMHFPLRQALLRHSIAPTATLHADIELARHLLPPSDAAPSPDGLAVVELLHTGTAFWYKGKAFLVSGKLSKRHYATDLKSGRLYSFSAQCRVRVLDNPLQATPDSVCLGAELAPGQHFVHRSRRFRLEKHSRSRMFCTDLATGQPVELHGLMHVAI